jgi:zinc/manganese transport system substrate-binding protein
MRHPFRRCTTAVCAVAACVVLAACGSSTETVTGPAGAGVPTVVVTTAVLGSLVRDLVGDAARVEVLMPDGTDPHDWQPSAQDIESLRSADLIVENGLRLEEALAAALDAARADGIPVFTAADHVEVRKLVEGDPAGAEHGEEEHGAGDPHLWTDPLAMRAVVSALGHDLRRDLGLDLAPRQASLERRLEELDRELGEALRSIPADRRKLVTGHESMGYYADRYGLTLVGAVLPGLSSQADASAADLATLSDVIEREGVTVVFDEVGTPRHVVQSVAGDVGARIVELPSHTLPKDGSYFTFMRDVAAAVEDGLTKGS